jgi:hypothetical protein
MLYVTLRFSLSAQFQIDTFDPHTIATEDGWLLGRRRLRFGKGNSSASIAGRARDGYSIYNARTVIPGVAFCFTATISVFAAGPEEAGFCPVISKPSLTT